MRLSRQVGRAATTALVLVAVAAVYNLALLVYLGFSLDPALTRATDGARALRVAHQGMIDQETGLRAYLITADESVLEPYRSGITAQLSMSPLARTKLSDQPELVTLIDARQKAVEAWTAQWAAPARERGPEFAASPVNDVEIQFVQEGVTLFDAYRRAYATAQEAADQHRFDLEGPPQSCAQDRPGRPGRSLPHRRLRRPPTGERPPRGRRRPRRGTARHDLGAARRPVRLAQPHRRPRRASRDRHRARRHGARALPAARRRRGPRARPDLGPRGGRRRQRRQVGVPRHHVARDPHADERGDRHDRPAARLAADRSATRVHRDRATQRRLAAHDHQRRPGLLEDRVRRAGARAAAVRAA